MPADTTTFSNPLEELFSHHAKEATEAEKKSWPFRVRVVVVPRRPPRHEMFTYILEVGSGFIDKVMNKEPLSGSLTFIFPERHLGVAEKQAFMTWLTDNPTAKEISEVNILTAEPLLVSNFHKESIRVMTWPEDAGKYDGTAHHM